MLAALLTHQWTGHLRAKVRRPLRDELECKLEELAREEIELIGPVDRVSKAVERMVTRQPLSDEDMLLIVLLADL